MSAPARNTLLGKLNRDSHSICLLRRAAPFRIALLGMLAFVPAVPVVHSGEIYKWVDENGVTHFSQQPPDSDSQADIVDVDVNEPSSTEAERARRRTEDLSRRNEVWRRQRESEKTEEARKTARREKRCNDLRSLLSAVTASHRVKVPDGEGGTLYLSDEERDRYVADLRAQVERHCE